MKWIKAFSLRRRSLAGGVISAVLSALVWTSCGGPTGGDDNPVLSVTPVLLDFGETRTSLTLTISNAGSGVLDWSVQVPSEGWVSVNQASGTVQ